VGAIQMTEWKQIAEEGRQRLRQEDLKLSSEIERLIKYPKIMNNHTSICENITAYFLMKPLLSNRTSYDLKCFLVKTTASKELYDINPYLRVAFTDVNSKQRYKILIDFSPFRSENSLQIRAKDLSKLPKFREHYAKYVTLDGGEVIGLDDKYKISVTISHYEPSSFLKSEKYVIDHDSTHKIVDLTQMSDSDLIDAISGDAIYLLERSVKSFVM
jgi:hypothetical protein